MGWDGKVLNSCNFNVAVYELKDFKILHLSLSCELNFLIFRCPAEPGASLVTGFHLIHHHGHLKVFGFHGVSFSSFGFLKALKGSLKFFRVSCGV